MKKALPLIASFSLAAGACGGDGAREFTSFAELLEEINTSDDMTNSRAYGIGVGIVEACEESPETTPLEGFVVDLRDVDAVEYNGGLADGTELVEKSDQDICGFRDAPWNQ